MRGVAVHACVLGLIALVQTAEANQMTPHEQLQKVNRKVSSAKRELEELKEKQAIELKAVKREVEGERRLKDARSEQAKNLRSAHDKEAEEVFFYNMKSVHEKEDHKLAHQFKLLKEAKAKLDDVKSKKEITAKREADAKKLADMKQQLGTAKKDLSNTKSLVEKLETRLHKGLARRHLAFLDKKGKTSKPQKSPEQEHMEHDTQKVDAQMKRVLKDIDHAKEVHKEKLKQARNDLQLATYRANAQEQKERETFLHEKEKLEKDHKQRVKEIKTADREDLEAAQRNFGDMTEKRHQAKLKDDDDFAKMVEQDQSDMVKVQDELKHTEKQLSELKPKLEELKTKLGKLGISQD